MKGDSLTIIILAAGLGKRMGTQSPKVMVRARNRPLIDYVLDTALSLEASEIIVVTGYGRNEVESFVTTRNPKIKFAFQSEQRGTGHAVKTALDQHATLSGTYLILYGDSPLLEAKSLKSLLEVHRKGSATVSLLSFVARNPTSYGRVIRDSSKRFVQRIIEAKDCSSDELLINEVNLGVYAVDSAFLPSALSGLKDANSQKELYLTDIVEKASSEGQTVLPVMVSEIEGLGVNDRYDLALVEAELNRKKIVALARSGVTFEDLGSVIVEDSVSVGAGTFVGPNVKLKGNTSIAENVIIEGTALIDNCTIEPRATIKLGVRMEDSKIGPEAMVGPFAHLRPGTILGKDVKIGNFVETKKAILEEGAKASHLTYLGDCKVGEETNIGAGTITCNYDGFKKYETSIGKNVFIGSNSSLVAPVTIEDGATIGAGSVITKKVSRDSLALTRAPQTEKEGWSKRKRDRAK